MSDAGTVYLIAHGTVTVLLLQRLFVIERRMGTGDFIMDRLKRCCPYFRNEKKPSEGCEE